MRAGEGKPLPRSDRHLLDLLALVVPCQDRDEWTRTWYAELWHVHHAARYRAHRAVAGLAIGVACDAMWMRTDSLKRRWAGTAALCLAELCGLIGLAALIGIGVAGSEQSFASALINHLGVSTASGVLVLLVTFGTTFRRRPDQGLALTAGARLRRIGFFAAKTLLVWLLAFLLSTVCSIPLQAQFPNVADLFQAFDLVLFAVSGLRWVVADQEFRCKQCLHLLTTPARIGRPSHNLLEWNGTELSCKHGHGLLSIPEMETSWRDASQWIAYREA